MNHNLIDATIVFHPLTMEDLVQIADIQLRWLQGLLAELSIALELSGRERWRAGVWETGNE